MRVLLLDGGKEPLATFGDDLSRRAAQELETTRRRAAHGLARHWHRRERARRRRRRPGTERIAARTVVWAAGVQASPLAKMLADATGAEVDRAGRIATLPDLTLPGHPEVFAVGDMVTLNNLPGVAEVAMQGSLHAANTIVRRLAARPRGVPFTYRDLGSVAAIGRFRAICSVGRLRLSGFAGWVVWMFVHLAFLNGLGNRFDDDAALAALVGRPQSGRAGVQRGPHRRRSQHAPSRRAPSSNRIGSLRCRTTTRQRVALSNEAAPPSDARRSRRSGRDPLRGDERAAHVPADVDAAEHP